MKWKCLRCDVTFTEEDRMLWKSHKLDCPCDCKKNGETYASPWEPIPEIEFKIERVVINPKSRKLEGDWTVELDPEVVCMCAAPETKWDRFCHWFKYLFIKGKVEKL